MIEPGKMVIVNPAAATPPVPSGTIVSGGALTVVSAQPLAGMVLEHDSSNPAIILQATRGFAPQDADTKLFAPIIKNQYRNRFTGLQIQNTTNAPIDIKVTYKGDSKVPECAGQTYTNEQKGVVAGASANFVHQVGQTGNTMPEGCLATATVEATGKVVAIVSESYTQQGIALNAGRQKATTYSALPANAATNALSAPVYKENQGNKQTGLLVQNVGTSPATDVVATFVNSLNGSTFTSKKQTIQPGAGLNFITLSGDNTVMMTGDVPLPPGVLYGVTVTADQPVVAVANESTFPFGGSPLIMDNNNYEAFNK
jgi:hypothetical protein